MMDTNGAIPNNAPVFQQRLGELENLMDNLINTVKEFANDRLTVEVRAGFLHLLDKVSVGKQLGGFAGDAPEALYGAVLSLAQGSGKRIANASIVTCFNPTIDVEGWESDHTVVQVLNDDMPFLIDSMVNYLTEKSISIHSILHPIVNVLRDGNGKRTQFVDGGSKGAIRESLIQIQIDRRGSDAECQALRAEFVEMFDGIHTIVDDWQPMVKRIGATGAVVMKNAPAPEEDRKEVADFIDWVCDDHFILMGARSYLCGDDGVSIVRKSGLGLMRDADFTVLRDRDGNFAYWTDEMEAFIAEESPILILKANRKTDIHRSAHFDFIGIKHYDADGKVTGKDVFIGLFTSAAYNRNARRIPLLRQKVTRVHEMAGFSPKSHDGKALANVLETYPRDELFQISEEQLLSNAVGIMQLVARPRASVFVRPDRFSRFVSCLTYVPRENYTTEMRKKIGDILADALDGRVAEFTPYFGEGALVRIHFVVAADAKDISDVDVDLIKERIRKEVRGWADELMDALVHHSGEAEGNVLFGRYRNGFPGSYRDEFSTAAAAADIEKLEQTTANTPLALKFYHRMIDPANAIRLKLFFHNDPLPLSDCLPVLEGMGFRVMQERPFKVRRGDEVIWVHDFLMHASDGEDIDIAALRGKLEDGFAAVWQGAVDNDPLNRQILLSGLNIRQTVLLRAYKRYLMQAKLPFSTAFIEDAINGNPTIARMLVKMFEAMFDPANGLDEAGRGAEEARLAGEIEIALEAVSSLQVDQILRRLRNAVQSTLRTNYFQPDAEGNSKPYISFKLKSSMLDELPLPRPWREIFVYSTWVEGVHLRFGPIARGGLRWSDRSEDYRTEVLGLVKAQQVKNAVIVPVGSKGGFLPKSLPAGGSRDEVVAEAIRCYKTYLSGMLDITDNLVDDSVVPPANVLRRDGDDPYLVVAADKGTATFSDIANGVAEEFGFWLDDAFASGGSHGYDHKGMGITARGAWEAVKRHFRELGLDTQSEPFNVIGVGDMSGDVFGNGMLLSEQINLNAAFDHRDIFIDPTPDAAKSFAERQRLFDTPRCTWQDYNKDLISKGGGIFSRAAKSITLTPEIQALTGLADKKVTPLQLIKALLQAKTDLIWFGGIGTYIKASDETHADADDRANDAIRVDATEIQARVIGEGANLGVTQRARVEMAYAGKKVNTDAVDNSAGVECSDHEVNIKIALGAVVAAGDMTQKQRNTLLAEMTDNVAEQVLRTNYIQTQAITMVETRAPGLVEDHIALMQAFEERGLLDRQVEFLPDNDTMWERKADGRGLTRPEISVILAYAKNIAFADLVRSDALDDGYFDDTVLDYMPVALRERFKDVILSHRLKREIVGTVLTNALIDQTGPAFFVTQGADIATIACAFVVVREVFALDPLASEIDALDNIVPAHVQTQMHLQLRDFTRIQVLNLMSLMADRSISGLVKDYAAGAAAIQEGVCEMLPEFLSDRQNCAQNRLQESGVPEGLAIKISRIESLYDTLFILDQAAASGISATDAAALHFEAGARFGLDWLRVNAVEVQTLDHWERTWLERLLGELRSQHLLVCAKMGRDDLAELTGQADDLMSELRSGGDLTLAKLAVASSRLREILV